MGADISRLPSNTENPLVNDYWFSLWWKMGQGCGEFISGNDGPSSKRPSRSTCFNRSLFLRRLCCEFSGISCDGDSVTQVPGGHVWGRASLSLLIKTSRYSSGTLMAFRTMILLRCHKMIHSDRNQFRAPKISLKKKITQLTF